MARHTHQYACQSCGAAYPKWSGRCESCGAWNTLVEEALESEAPARAGGLGRGKARGIDFAPLAGAAEGLARRLSAVAEFDRTTGGGLVPGGCTLIGGDPGIGKSTLVLQLVARLSGSYRTAYVSGEESIDQVRLRAKRLGLATAPVGLAAATDVREIVASIDQADGPEIVVIDSIQTMYVDTLDSAPGTVAQVRASAQALIRIAKRRGISLLLVGHVTKEGLIAGPRVLEHMVDTVLYFEGERGHQFRILRAVKNRYGPTDEIGVFDMTDRGLEEVPNPSELFLAERRGDISGTAVFAGIEGTRPVLVEVQALVGPAALGTARRAVVGWDSARLAMVLAVLEARCGVTIGSHDVYLNIAGGLRIAEPAADLAVAAALISALSGEAVPAEMVIFGEIGLAGEVRGVGQAELRLKEAAKLGFTRAVIPSRRQARGTGSAQPVAATEIGHLSELIPLFGSGQNTPAARIVRGRV
ncbi:MAG TPA: DNA repair protein RadA [Alphaproteobacteria bacterium]|nr:DNA repair protein RadA [Alphaproteobacteria bacterium]